MQLYYSPGACSLAPHIVAREAGIPVELVKVDITGDHKTETGVDYYTVNPRGYVPALRLDDGTVHTEASILVQRLADMAPGSGLMPTHGSDARLEAQEWLNFVASELHRMFSPWLWHKETADTTKASVKARLRDRMGELDRRLAGRDYITGDRFTAVDAYAFTIVNWSNFLAIDLKPFANLSAFMARVAARPKVHEALVAEGLAK